MVGSVLVKSVGGVFIKGAGSVLIESVGGVFVDSKCANIRVGVVLTFSIYIKSIALSSV